METSVLHSIKNDKSFKALVNNSLNCRISVSCDQIVRIKCRKGVILKSLDVWFKVS